MYLYLKAAFLFVGVTILKVESFISDNINVSLRFALNTMGAILRRKFIINFLRRRREFA